MKLLSLTGLAALASSLTVLAPVQAQDLFGETQVSQDNYIAVAQPYGNQQYSLLVIEQIPGKKQCWSESGVNPTTVNPLLLNFDFTGQCSRFTDSNSYSIRIDGKDYGLDYLLRFVKRDNDLLLVGTPRQGTGLSELVVGRTFGVNDGFLKVDLDPGWQFSRRTYGGKTLGHTYFSGDSAIVGKVEVVQPTPDDSVPPSDGGVVVAPSTFKDIGNDVYREEIKEAVAIGFVAGFKQDNTFRPEESLTREQLVSLVVEALKTIPALQVSVPLSTMAAPYKDVDSARWSASKIQWAQENQIVSGYKDGTFKPTKAVTRAELMAILRRAAEFAASRQGKTMTLSPMAEDFDDLGSHWGAEAISMMAAYCRTASPLNEQGKSFYPDLPSKRNYAAAATLRTLKCLQE